MSKNKEIDQSRNKNWKNHRNDKTKNWVFKMIKLTNHYLNEEKTEMNKIRSKEDISTHTTRIQRIRRDYYEQTYPEKFMT